MNEFYTLLWAAMGALLPIIGTTLAVANHVNNRFEALGDRIDRVSAELDKLYTLETERRQAQHEAQADYREKIEYLINDNRGRADHHRQALEKQLNTSNAQVDRRFQELSNELKDFRGYLAQNSDYIPRQKRNN